MRREPEIAVSSQCLARSAGVLLSVVMVSSGKFREKQTGVVIADRRVEKWETCFWFSTFPSRSAAAVGMWKSRGLCEISKGLWEAGETCFWFSTLPTAPPFPQRLARDHPTCLAIRHWARSAHLAFCICCAASVSLIRLACSSNVRARMPSFKYCSQLLSDCSFSYGV